MAIQDDTTLVTKGDLKALYSDKIAPYLGANLAIRTNVSDYYSEDEKVIGVWIDGKPIYQRTYDLGSAIEISSTTWYNTGFSYGDTDIVIKVFGQSGLGSSTTTNVAVPLLCYAESPTPHNYYIMVAKDNSSIRLRYFTVQYTKTTDTASSALTAGCYDINFPNTWPENKEIYFGNGVYGQRFTGTITAAASEHITKTLLSSPSFKVHLVNWGGEFYYKATATMPVDGCWSDATFSGCLDNMTLNGDNLNFGSKSATARTNAPYSIWVLYTKG